MLVYLIVEALPVNVPFTTSGVPELVRVVVALPAFKVALAVTVKTLSTVVVVVPPKVVVKTVAASPMDKLPKTRVPAVPAQDAPFEPMQLEPEAELFMVVVPALPWLSVWPEATLTEPELALEVEPTVRAFEPTRSVPDLTLSSLAASIATPAVKLPVPLILRL